MNQRELQKEATRKHILKVAKKAMALRPFREFTTAAIAEEAGVSHGTIFSHFPTRDALLVAVAGRICRMIEKGFAENITDETGLEGMLHAHLLGLHTCERSYMRLVVNGGGLPKEAVLMIRRHQDGIGKQMLEAYQREPGVKMLDPGLLFATWLGLVNYTLSFRRRFAQRGSVARNTGPRLVAHMMAMIRSEG